MGKSEKKAKEKKHHKDKSHKKDKEKDKQRSSKRSHSSKDRHVEASLPGESFSLLLTHGLLKFPELLAEIPQMLLGELFCC